MKLNNIEFKSCGPAYNNGGYTCIMSLNNTIPDKKKNESRTEVNFYRLRLLSTGPLNDLI